VSEARSAERTDPRPIALVTGAGTGIGAACARALDAAGFRVAVHYRSSEAQAREVAAKLSDALLVKADLAVPEQLDALVAELKERAGRVDVLVNNAGITRDQLMVRMKPEDWDAVVRTNLTAAFTCTQAVLRSMIKQRGGRIISISSVVGQAGNAGQANYAAAKAGLIGFSKSLALEVASRGVTVNVVAPGLIETDMTRALPEEARKTWAEKIPLGRVGAPEDVAGAVCFLASDEASYITGQIIAVNGGMYM
jgi:3-oxoacyl-[acyl-carrier protein] reductase